MSVELKPCPFCGSKYVEIIKPFNKEYQVQCGDCYATSCVETTPKKAVKAWNRRAKIEICFGVPVDRLRELAAADKDGRVVVMPAGEQQIENPLEPLKVFSALKSELLKYNYRLENSPEDISPLDITIVYALQDVLNRADAEAAMKGEEDAEN